MSIITTNNTTLYAAEAEMGDRYSERHFYADTDTDAVTFARFIFNDWHGATVRLSWASLSIVPRDYVANQPLPGRGASTVGIAEWTNPGEMAR